MYRTVTVHIIYHMNDMVFNKTTNTVRYNYIQNSVNMSLMQLFEFSRQIDQTYQALQVIKLRHTPFIVFTK